ncbi:MAG: autotransporter-associated beta strand repeat-containing protein [Lentisphaerae bacterium]|nr:autotransporter-associated beta strand repeat-containing protein [Lentisphaerota bacterium]
MVADGGALDLNGQAVGAEPVLLNGAGSDGGALINNGATAASLSGPITLGSDSSLGGRRDLTLGTNVISGAFGLTKTGTNTVALPSGNGYTGRTTVHAGRLSINAETALGPNPATYTADQLMLDGGSLLAGQNGAIDDANRGVTLGAGGGGFEVPAGLMLTVTNLISGPGMLTKAGAGTLVLLGDNTYAGNTTIGAGTLQVGSNSASGRITGTVLDHGTLTFNRSDAFAFDDLITGSGGVIKQATNTLTLNATNTFGGTLWVQNGALVLPTLGDAINGSGNIKLGSANTAGELIYIGDADAVLSRGIDMAGTNGGATVTANGTGVLSLAGFNISGGGPKLLTLRGSNTGPNTLAGAVSNSIGNTAVLKTGSGTWTLSGSNTFSGGMTLSGGTLNINNPSALGSALSVFTLGGGVIDNTSGGPITLTNNNPQVWNANVEFTGTQDLNLGGGTVTLSTNRQITVNGSALTVAGSIAGLANLAKAGPGTLTLSGAASSFGGPGKSFTMNAGTLNLNKPTATGAASTLLVINGGVLDNTSAALVTTAAYPQNWNASFTFTGTRDLAFGAGAVTLNITPVVTVNAGVLTVGGGIVATTNGLIKAGAGTLTLAAANSFAGDLEIDAGTLRVGAVGAIPSGAGKGNLLLDGTLDLNAFAPALNGLTGAGVVTNSAITPVMLTVGGNNANGTFNGTLYNGSGGGVVGLSKTGAGVQTLGGSNAYSGATAINAGALKIQHGNALGAVTAGTVVAAGGALQLQGGLTTGPEPLTLNGTGVATNGALRNIAGTNTYTGIITLGTAARFNSDSDLLILDVPGAMAINVTTFGVTFGGDGNLAVIDPIAGTTATLTKDGAGTLTLAATNTYAGTTTVNGGTLLINGSTTPGASVTVNSGGALGGAGSLRGPVTVNTGGTLTPGASVGTLTFTNLTLQAGTTNVFEFNTTPAHDQMVITGLNGFILNACALALYQEDTTNAWTVDGTYPLIQYTGTLGGTGINTLSVANPQPGKTYAFSAVGGWVLLTMSSATVWDGGSATDSHWLTVENWDGDTAPLTGAELQFGGTTRLANENTFADNTPFAGITFLADGGSFTLDGNAVNLTAGVVNRSANEQTIRLPLVLDGNSRTFDTAAGNLVVGGSIGQTNGTWSLVKIGPAELTLAASNTFGGTVAVNAGAVNIGHANALGSTASPTIVSNGAALHVHGDITTAAEPLTLNGAGAAADGALRNVSGTNAYAGLITLASASRINSDAGLLALDVAAGNAVTSAAQNVTFGGAGDIAIPDPIAITSGMVIKDGAGTLVLSGTNSYGGPTFINAGVLNLRSAGGLGTVAGGAQVASGAALFLQGGVTIGAEPLTLNGSGVANDGALRSAATGTNLYAGLITLASTSRVNCDTGLLALDVAAGASVTGTAQHVTFGGAGDTTVPDSIGLTTGSLTKDGTGTLILSGVNTYSGPTLINSGVLSVRSASGLGTVAGGVQVANNAALCLQGGIAIGAEALTLNGSGIANDGALRNVALTNSYAGAITLGSASRINADAGGLLILSGGVQGAGLDLTLGGTGNLTFVTAPIATVTGGLTKDGSGVALLSVANTYTGLTDIRAGTLRFGIANALASGNVQITGGALDIGAFADSVGTVTLVNGLITGAGGALSSTDAFVLENGTVSANLAGGAPMIKNTPGTVALNTANTLTGSVTVNAGTLRLGNAQALGPVATAVLNFGAASDGRVQLNGTSIALAGLNAPDGQAIVENGNATTNVTLTVTNLVASGFAGVLQNGGAAALAFIKTGAGALTLSGTNTYSGATTIAAGTLKLGAADILPNGAGKGDVILSASLDLAGFSETINGLSGAGVVTNTAPAPATLTIGDGNASQIFTGVIKNGAGTIALTKIGTGMTTLSAPANGHQYRGDTTIAAGTLRLGVANQIPDGVAGGNVVVDGILDLNGLAETINGLSGAGIVTNGVAGVTLTAGGNNADGTFTGTLYNGTGIGLVALSKIGTGVLTLGGSNAYSGITSISAGAVTIQHGNALGAISGGTTVTAGGALQIQGGITTAGEPLTLNGTGMAADGALRNLSGTNTYAGLITLGSAARMNSDHDLLTLDGPGAASISATTFGLTIGGAGHLAVLDPITGTTATLTKDGAGTLTLAATNTYTGATTINAGTLAVNGASAPGGVFTVNSGGTLGGSGTIRGPVTVNAGGMLAPGASVGTLTCTNLTILAGATNLVEFNTLPAQDRIVITGTNGLTIQGCAFALYEAGTTNAWTVDGTYTLMQYAGTIAGGGVNVLSVANPLPNKLYTFALSGGKVMLTIGSRKTWDGGSATDNNWQSGDNWDDDAAPEALAALLFAGSQRTSNTNDLPANTPVSSLTFAPEAAPFHLAGAPMKLAGAVVNDSANLQTVALPLILDSNGREFSASNGDLRVTGSISDGGQLYGLNKTGLHALTLAGSNSFGGMLAVNAGALNMEHAYALGSTAGGTTVSNGSALQLRGGITTAAEPVTLNGAGVASGGALRNLAGSNTFGGTITLASTSRIHSDAGRLTLDVAIGNAITGTTQTVTFDGAGDVVVADPIAVASGSVIKEGTGTLTVQGANTYTGATLIVSGAINVQHATGLGTAAGGVLVATDAALQMQGGAAVGAEALTLDGTGMANDGALRNIGGANSYGGLITLTSDSRINADAGTLTLSGGVAGAGLNLTVGGAGTVSFAGGAIATGTGALTKDGAGTAVLAATNTYTGLTEIQSGVLKYGAINALGAGNVLIDGGTFDLATFADTVGTVTLTSGAIIGTSGILSSTNAFVLESGTVSGILGGSAGVTKQTGSTVLLSGPNSYAGGTTINGGMLVLGNATALGAPAGARVTFAPASSATLQLNGNAVVVAGISGPDGMATVENGSDVASAMLTVTVTNTASFAGTVRNGGVASIALVKNGAGTQALAGDGAFTGGTTLNQGTLQVGRASSLGAPGALLQINGGILDLASDTSVNGYNTTLAASVTMIPNRATPGPGILHTLGPLSLGNVTVTVMAGTNVTDGVAGLSFGATTFTAATPVLNIASNASLALGSLSGNVPFSKVTGTGTLTLNGTSGRTSGAVTISAGTLALAASDGLGTTAVTLTLSNGSTLVLASDTSVTAYPTIVGAGGATVVADRATPGSGITHTLGALTVANQLNILLGSNVVNAAAGVTFGPTMPSSAVSFAVADGATLTLGALGATGFPITKQGGGTLTLNTPAGARGAATTTLAAGTLRVGSTGAINNAPSPLNISGGTLSLGIDAGGAVMGANVTVGGTSSVTVVVDRATSGIGPTNTLGTLSIGAGRLTVLAGDHVASGTPTLAFGPASLTGDPTFDVTAPAALLFNSTLGGSSLADTLATFRGSGSTTVTGAISNGLGRLLNLTVDAAGGSVTLLGNNTFTGKSTVLGGTLRIGAENRLGANPATPTADQLTLNGGTLEAIATFTIQNPNRDLLLGPEGGTIETGPGVKLTLARPVTGPGDLRKTGAGTLSVAATNAYTGETLVNNGMLEVVTNGSLSATFRLTVAPGAALRLAHSDSLRDEVLLHVATGSGKVDLTNGVNETIGVLYLSGTQMVAGTWGSSASGAEHKDDTYFTGAGMLTSIGPDLDADGDGMGDKWEIRYFGSTNAVGGQAGADGDGDSSRNLDEYIAGSDPTNENSAFEIGIAWSEEPTVTVSIATEVAGPYQLAGVARFYALEAATNLKSAVWGGVPGYTNILGDHQTVLYTAPAATNTIPRYYRGRAQLLGP